MPRERSCDYCGADIEPGTGTMFVHVDGEVVQYCSAKCEKNAALGREARDLEWTAEGQRIGAARAGTPDEVEQVAAEPPETGADTVAEGVDTVPAESEAEAVAAAAGDTGSRAGEPAAAGDERTGGATGSDDEEIERVAGRRAGGTDEDLGEEEAPAGAGPGEETDPEAADATADEEEMVRETDETDDEQASEAEQ